jgi:selenocysteine lyase/cysteine desulfurase
MGVATFSWPQIVSVDGYEGPREDELRAHTNLDYAATTPALQAAVDAVLVALPHYGSVHRGGGVRSDLTTDAYEQAREAVARFLGCPDDRIVVFVRNTTEAINLVAATLPHKSRVLCSPLEHHANLLPWRQHDGVYLPFTDSADELVECCREAIEQAERARQPFNLLAICGASNVTGEILPAEKLTAIAHAAGVEVLLDAAQLAPHRRIDLKTLDVDYLALSGHKLYAPFGVGALVVRRDSLQTKPPLLQGGGAVRIVTLDDVAWADLPHRFEAGTPNVLGAIALGAATDALHAWGFSRLAEEEERLAQRLWNGLNAIDGCRILNAWAADSKRVAVASFALKGHHARDVAAALARDHAIAVRSGLFCAHPFVSHLLGTPASLLAEVVREAHQGRDVQIPGAVRASIGIGVTDDDIDRLLDGVASIAHKTVL